MFINKQQTVLIIWLKIHGFNDYNILIKIIHIYMFLRLNIVLGYIEIKIMILQYVYVMHNKIIQRTV